MHRQNFFNRKERPHIENRSFLFEVMHKLLTQRSAGINHIYFIKFCS